MNFSCSLCQISLPRPYISTLTRSVDRSAAEAPPTEECRGGIDGSFLFEGVGQTKKGVSAIMPAHEVRPISSSDRMPYLERANASRQGCSRF